MEVLTFTDPREVAAYWDRFEPRSIRAMQPYLWEWPGGGRKDDEKALVTRINREELDLMVIDPETAEIRIGAATWVQHQNFPEFQNILILTHYQREGSDFAWDVKVAAAMFSRQEAENLSKQILGAVPLAFPVVESS